MKKKASNNFLKYMYDIKCILCYSFTIFISHFGRSLMLIDACLHQPFLVVFLYFSGKKEDSGINDAIAMSILQKISPNIVLVVMKHFQNALLGPALLHSLD